MTTSLPHTRIRLSDLSELVAGIPHVLGFTPTSSLVLFTFRRCPQLRLSVTIRVDLPKRDHVQLAADEVAAAVSRSKVTAAIAVVVADAPRGHGQFIELLRKTLAEKEILLTHASWVRKVAHGERWQCYDDPLCTELVPDPQTSALAVAVAVAGETTYPSRDAVAAHLAPDPEEVLAHRKELLHAYRNASPQPYTDADVLADLGVLGRALDKASLTYDPPDLDDTELVRLADALSKTPVKDECLAMALSDESEPAERLWSTLVRALPPPERAEPALLLAFSAYLRGAGVLASLALKIVLEANPDHRLALLLDHALHKGVPPDHIRAMLVASVINNKSPVTSEDDDDPPWNRTGERPNESRSPGAPSPKETTEQAAFAAGSTGAGSDPQPSSGSMPTGGPSPTGTTDTAVAKDDREYVSKARPVSEPGDGEPVPSAPGSGIADTVDRPGTRGAGTDALTVFLPSPTARSEPG